MKRLAIVLCVAWLPVASERDCGLRIGDCGFGGTDVVSSIPQSAIRNPQLAPLTIGRLHYDGGGD